MRAIIYCFSGTGNTKRICDALAEELRRLGHVAEVFPIRKDFTPPPPNGYGCVIVGYPVHAFNAPTPVIRFLKSLSAAQKFVPTYLIRTSGEPLGFNRASGITPKRILKERGYRVRGEFSFVMPYNIIFKHTEGMAVRMLQAAEKQIPAVARTILSGKGKTEKNGLAVRSVSFLLRIEHTAMPFLGRRYKATERCTGCGHCAKVCPQGNIKMENGRPVFGKDCVGCMGCSFSCPNDALKISLLNGWRVNGAYEFSGAPATDDEVCKYCRKSYLKYFHENER